MPKSGFLPGAHPSFCLLTPPRMYMRNWNKFSLNKCSSLGLKLVVSCFDGKIYFVEGPINCRISSLCLIVAQLVFFCLFVCWVVFITCYQLKLVLLLQNYRIYCLYLGRSLFWYCYFPPLLQYYSDEGQDMYLVQINSPICASILHLSICFLGNFSWLSKMAFITINLCLLQHLIT